MPEINPLTELELRRFETTTILKALASANRALAEFKGVAKTMPNQGILINTLALQEAKDSSAIENIVTTHDELFRSGPDGEGLSIAAKEVSRYQEALRIGFDRVLNTGLLTNNDVLEIQKALELNNAGFRKLPGTTLKNSVGDVVYTPPQDARVIQSLMNDFELFINDHGNSETDPLIKMAIAHHQFESIHPFYDANGRTGRILNVLYLVKESLLDIPVLYLSRHIIRTKEQYYALLQAVRDEDVWEEWVLYMLIAVERTAIEGIQTIADIRQLVADYKHRIRGTFKFYSQDLINNLFSHPYTKIDFIRKDLGVSRITATRYLEELAREGFVEKMKIGRSNYYVNRPLCAILAGVEGAPAA